MSTKKAKISTIDLACSQKNTCLFIHVCLKYYISNLDSLHTPRSTASSITASVTVLGERRMFPQPVVSLQGKQFPRLSERENADKEREKL